VLNTHSKGVSDPQSHIEVARLIEMNSRTNSTRVKIEKQRKVQSVVLQFILGLAVFKITKQLYWQHEAKPCNKWVEWL
jgi:hypothetical protein